jgi:universal stress protein E
MLIQLSTTFILTQLNISNNKEYIMIAFKKILVVTSTDSIQPSVISQSARIAQKHQSHVTFFNVIEDLPQEQLKWITALPPQELMTNVVAEKEILLSDYVNSIEGKYPSVDTSVKVGLPFIETTKKVQQGEYDLVLLAAKSKGKPRKSFFGSTTVHLMRKCPCPVLTIGDNSDKPIRRIVAAIDVYAPTAEGR